MERPSQLPGSSVWLTRTIDVTVANICTAVSSNVFYKPKLGLKPTTMWSCDSKTLRHINLLGLFLDVIVASICPAVPRNVFYEPKPGLMWSQSSKILWHINLLGLFLDVTVANICTAVSSNVFLVFWPSRNGLLVSTWSSSSMKLVSPKPRK